ncbi:MAG TPA: alpha/beta hydrolase, partial [Gemmatimonadales bacterium]|nr:alpha/beta hydrolase [Gemmatimonadales bacterium]
DPVYDRLWAALQDLDIPVLARQLRLPALVVHDVHDPDVPWTEGQQLAAAWHGAVLHTTERLGHRAILRDAGVIAKVIEFLK